MLIEIVSIIGLVLFTVLVVKEKDWKYPLFFLLGFVMTLTVEPFGVADSVWTWGEIMMPFGYMFLGVPLAVYLIYSFAGSLVVFVTKVVIKFRNKNKEFDKKIAFFSIIIGVVFLFMILAGMHVYIGFTFVLFGLYLLVKDPAMFYVGFIGLTADLIIEYIFIINGQLEYTISYGDVGLGFFLGGSILSALFILIERKHGKLGLKS